MHTIQKDHSGSGDIVTQLRLEIQQLREEALLSQELSTSRQAQIDVLQSQLANMSSKLTEVRVDCLNDV